MYRPLRKQACSHRFCGWSADSVNILNPPDSGLAHRFCEYPKTRGSELAREDFLSGKADVLNVPAPSQASLFPQIRWLTQIRGSELAREGCVSGREEMLDVPAPSQASLLPQVLWCVQTCGVLKPLRDYRKSRMSRSSLRPTKIEIDSRTTENATRMPIESSSGPCPPIRAER